MLARLCQLKSLTLVALLATSCSFFKSKENSQELVSLIEPKWFPAKPAHSITNQEGKYQSHLFFDVKPELSNNGQSVNVVVLTPEDSEYAYKLDLNSGQRHFDHAFCKQKDIWNVYNGSVGKPKFTVAVMPQTLDQLGEPQKVIVFGGAKKFAVYPDLQFHRVRLIGAFVEQRCPEGNCLGKNNWLSKLVFIGLDPDDKTLEKVQTIEDFRNKFDWVEMKATLENMHGYNGMADLTFPMIRLGQLIPLEEAIDYHKKRSISLNEAEKIQNSCTALYDRLYTDVGVVRPEDKAASTVEELNAKIKLKEELKKKRLPSGFARRLEAFTKKYSHELASCERFVYHGNINQDREKFWFLSYMGIFFRLHQEGYYFDCVRKTWQKNVLNHEGKLVYDLKENIDKCNEKSIDTAMNYVGNFLAGLKAANSPYYRFVDYDTHSFGTHRKMYSWVKVVPRTLTCSNKTNETFHKEVKIFPDDISWMERDVKDIADKMKIIY